jgi:hypothetical protein
MQVALASKYVDEMAPQQGALTAHALAAYPPAVTRRALLRLQRRCP